MTAALDTAMNEFLGEASEMLERLINNLTLVERNEHSRDTLASIYRDMHSIKGAAQLFGCPQLGQLAHSMETCLDPVRNGIMPLSPDFVDALFTGFDVMKALLESLRNDRREIDVSADLLKIIPRLTELTVQGLEGDLKTYRDIPGIPESADPRQIAYSVDSIEHVTGRSAAVDHTPDASLSVKAPAAPRVEPIKPVGNAVTEASTRDKGPMDNAGAETIRVNVSVLDNLMNLVGELVLIRNQVLQHAKNSHESSTDQQQLSQRLNVVTTELQNEVMKTRMQPIGNILTKFNRVVRDLARELDKSIDLEVEGADTELDKTLIEAVRDPLTHIVRNSVDHGIELPAERKKLGKSPAGRITIRSFHEGGQVIIEVRDDGRGLSPERIGRKAVEKGLVTAESMKEMTDSEVQYLIFAPGFSTADQVSKISGRGVGMDVVRTNIEKIGGQVELSSTEGLGSTIRLKIPLTLAIVPALIVSTDDEKFAIPQVKLVELVRVDLTRPDHGLEMLQGKPVYRLRGELLPLVSLSEMLGLAPADKPQGDVANIVVLDASPGWFGLIVESIEDSTDIVVKPLNSFMKDLNIYAGATVMGDGSVALTLDVVGLAARSRILEEKPEKSRDNSEDSKSPKASEAAEYILVDIGAPGVFAIPMVLVNRLEVFPSHAVEPAGGRRVVQYRGSILPVISAADTLKISCPSAQEQNDGVPVVVVNRGGRLCGLEVRRILDVISTDAEIDGQMGNRDGILGSMIYQDDVVVVLDAFVLMGGQISTNRGDLGETSKEIHRDSERQRFHVLVAEDNGFYRRHVERLLTEAGYRVTTEQNGEDALKRLVQSSEGAFNAVLSDIEMPLMTGWELATQVRKMDRFRDLPMIALTTRFSKADQERGRQVGFGRYLEKINPDQLIQELDDSLGIKGA